MSENGEPKIPDHTQLNNEPPTENQGCRLDSVEIRLEFEQRLPGGIVRFLWHSVRSPSRRRTPAALRNNPRIIVSLIVFVTIIIIGLIAVGPEGVWLRIKNLLPDISNKQA
jgi:hypothetical protein